MRKRNRGSSGVSRGQSALLIALFMAGILTFLGLSFSVFLDRDLYQANKTQLSTAAFYLAEAGMWYNKTENPNLAKPIKLQIPDANHVVVIWIDGSNNTIYCGKILASTNAVLAQRIIVWNPGTGGNGAYWFEGFISPTDSANPCNTM